MPDVNWDGHFLRGFTLDDVPWITFLLTLCMAAIYFVSPDITPLTYVALAPWMHAGFDHIWQNLLVFILLGSWIERRVGWITFLLFAVMIPYLALYLPVVFDYGGLSRGASGLTKALAGYAVPALFVVLVSYIESIESDLRKAAGGVVLLVTIAYLTRDGGVTVARFIGFEPGPDGVAVSAHMTGLFLGVLWFAWRAWRHGLPDA